jgi:hypothetical protein
MKTAPAGAGAEVDGDLLNTASLSDPAAAAELNSLVGKTDDALAFLEGWRPGGPWVLTSIVPDGGKTTTATFAAPTLEQMRRWIDARQGRQNIYFAVNVVFGDVEVKPNKGAISAIRALHVDVDPRVGEEPAAERDRALAMLRGYDPAPTVIVDSGGGMQAFWLLEGDVDVGGSHDLSDLVRRQAATGAMPLSTEEQGLVAAHLARLGDVVECRNLRIETDMQADACHNADRIMRLPGTINIPGQKKAKKGRVARLASVVAADWTRRYRLDAFPRAPKPMPGGGAPAAGGRVALPSDLPPVPFDASGRPDLPVSDRTKMLIVQGRDPDDPGRYASRSEAFWAVVCDLARAKVSDELIAAVCLSDDFPIARHALDQPKPRQYVERQIVRARGEADDSFDCDKEGRPIAASQRNIRLAMRKMGVVLRRDTFAGRNRVEGMEDIGPALDDPGLDRLWLLTDERFRFRPTREFFLTVLSDAARQNAFHPIVEYLAGLRWDGVPRIGRWLSTYGGADDTPYARAVGELMLVAAVRRVRQPGVKFDEMLVLESPQGTNKSTALKVLAVRDEWFADDLPLNAEAKRVIEALSGKWIVEAGELKGMRQGGANHLKGLLSRTHDKARMSYDRLDSEVPRQCVIVGTTNDSRYLRDLTGNRRFWPVAVTGFDLDALRRDRDQLWAEAAAREAEGAPIRLDPALWAEAAAEQDARRVEDPFFEALHAVLGEDMQGKLRAKDAWKIVGKQQGMRTQDDNERLGDAMRRLGFEATQRRFGAGPEAAYVRGDGASRIALEMGQDGEVAHAHLEGERTRDPF